VRGTLAPAIEDAMSKFTSDWLPAFFDAAQTATDYLRGALSRSPSEMFQLMISNMLDFQRIAGDALISAFVTAVSALSNALRALLANEVPTLIGDVVGQAFVYATATLSSALFKVLVEAVEYFGTLWQKASQMSAGDLLKKLMEVVQSFATGFGRAMIDPIGFITQKIGKGLADAFVDSGHEFKFQFDKATGSWIEKTDKALENTALAAGKKLGEAGSKLGDALVKSTKEAVRDTQVFQSNLFGSSEAAERIKDRAAEMAAYGKQFRQDMEAAAFDAEKFGQALRDAQVAGFAGPAPNSPFPANTRGGGATMPSVAPPMVTDNTTSKNPPTVIGGSGGGGGSNRPPPIDPLAAGRIGQMQGRYNERINDLMGRGNFGTAGRLAERRDERVRDRENFQRSEDFAGDRFGGNNFGESFRNYLDDLAKQGIYSEGITREQFEEWAKGQAKSEEERKKEDQENQAPGGARDKGSDGLGDISGKLDTIIKEITERLPQVAMGTAA